LVEEFGRERAGVSVLKGLLEKRDKAEAKMLGFLEELGYGS
jgi:hypothetical protein